MFRSVVSARRTRGAAWVVSLAWLAVGCGSDKQFEAAPPFEDVSDATTWLTSASAVSVYSHAYEPIGVADGALSYADPTCPVTSDDGTTLSIEGGCTDKDGKAWDGRATVERVGDDRTLTLSYLNGDHGTVHLRSTGVSTWDFDAALVAGGVTSIDYQGTIEGEYGGRATFNGSGRVERDGFLPPNGVVHAETVDEVVDDSVCKGQPVSGVTTVTARGDAAVVTYDGATDCDGDHNARLSVNGEDRGLITGIYCAVPNVGKRGAPGVPAVLVALSLIALRVRRRFAR